MGIKGFHHFLNKKDKKGIPCFVKRISLEKVASNSDNRIVIDGSNLRFSLYKLVDNGGTMADMGERITFMQMAYVVFDGFVRQQGESRAARSDEAANTIEKLRSGESCNDVLPPCLLREVKYNFLKHSAY